MGVLINGVWTDGELPQETGEGGRFKRAESRFLATVSLPTDPQALRPSPVATTSMLHTAARGRTAP